MRNKGGVRMANKIEIDIERKEGVLFLLDIDGERVLASDKLGEIMDRVEREVKKKYGIKTSKFGGIFGR